MSPWTYLAIAIAFEVVGTLFLQLSSGFEKLGYGLMALLCYGISFWVFAPALKSIPTGVAYAVWSGAGIVCVAILSFALLGQKLTWVQIAFMSLIVIGAIGLNMSSDIHGAEGSSPAAKL